MYYDVVFFKPKDVTVRLVGGEYHVIKPPGYTIQALNARPSVDQSAEVGALKAQVAQLEADLATCLAGDPQAKPTITNLTATPSSLPVGGGSVVIDATVTGADSLTLDGAPVTLPATVIVPG